MTKTTKASLLFSSILVVYFVSKLTIFIIFWLTDHTAYGLYLQNGKNSEGISAGVLLFVFIFIVSSYALMRLIVHLIMSKSGIKNEIINEQYDVIINRYGSGTINKKYESKFSLMAINNIFYAYIIIGITYLLLDYFIPEFRYNSGIYVINATDNNIVNGVVSLIVHIIWNVMVWPWYEAKQYLVW